MMTIDDHSADDNDDDNGNFADDTNDDNDDDTKDDAPCSNDIHHYPHMLPKLSGSGEKVG